MSRTRHSSKSSTTYLSLPGWILGTSAKVSSSRKMSLPSCSIYYCMVNSLTRDVPSNRPWGPHSFSSIFTQGTWKEFNRLVVIPTMSHFPGESVTMLTPQDYIHLHDSITLELRHCRRLAFNANLRCKYIRENILRLTGILVDHSIYWSVAGRDKHWSIDAHVLLSELLGETSMRVLLWDKVLTSAASSSLCQSLLWNFSRS